MQQRPLRDRLQLLALIEDNGGKQGNDDRSHLSAASALGSLAELRDAVNDYKKKEQPVKDAVEC